MSFWQNIRLFFAGPAEGTGSHSGARRGAHWARLGLRINLVLCVFAILGYALTQSSWGTTFRTASLGLLLASASFLVGALLGFLFGIPGTLQSNATPAPAAPAAAGAGAETAEDDEPAPAARVREPAYRSNTSLEQISDWLTKILVGLSLTQWDELRDGFQKMVEYAAPAFGPSQFREVFVGGTIVLAAICGFFASYLPTRLFLWLALTESDVEGSKLYDERKDRNLREANEAKKVGGAEMPPGEPGRAAAPGESEMVRKQISALASQYEALRASLPPGPVRTRKLEEICTQLRKLAPQVGRDLVTGLQQSGSPGERLAAVAWSQVFPQFADLGWLADRIGAEKPFIGYHAGVALLAAARNPSTDPGKVVDAVKRARSLLEPSDAGTDRARILAEAEQAAKSRT